MSLIERFSWPWLQIKVEGVRYLLNPLFPPSPVANACHTLRHSWAQTAVAPTQASSCINPRVLPPSTRGHPAQIFIIAISSIIVIIIIIVLFLVCATYFCLLLRFPQSQRSWHFRSCFAIFPVGGRRQSEQVCSTCDAVVACCQRSAASAPAAGPLTPGPWVCPQASSN